MANTLARAVARLKRLPRLLVHESAQRFDDIAETAAAREVPGGRMSRHGRGGRASPVTLGTVTTFGGTEANAEAVVVGTPAGPWVWLEYGTKPHYIGGPGQLLAGPALDHPVRGPVLHHGIVGRRTWTEAVDRLDHEVGPLADRLIEREVA